MKKMILLSLFAVVLASCVKETPVPGQGTSREVDIRLSTQAPVTRSGGDESINTVEVLVFDGQGVDPDSATFQYRRYAWQKNAGVYNTTLKIGRELDLYFAINAGEIIDNATLVEDVTTWAEVRRMLVMEAPDALPTNNLPMWGHKHNVELKDNDTNNINVQLMRSVATAFIDVPAADFALEKAYVAYGIDKGYLAFDHANTQTVNGILRITNPEVPAGAGVVATGTWSVPPMSPNKVEDIIYLFENDYSSEATETVARQHTKVILAGRYKSGQTTYYPLSFRNQQTGKKVTIARNRKYTLKITKVNGDGYPTLEDAEKGEDLNINYEVIEWDSDWNDEDILVDGVNYVSLSAERNYNLKHQAVLYRNAGSTDEINLKTNIALDQIELSLAGAPNTASGANAEVANDRFRVKLVEEKTEAGIHYCRLIFTALQDFTTEDISKLTVSAGHNRIQFNINVYQQNVNPDEDWNDGGGTGTTLGDK